MDTLFLQLIRHIVGVLELYVVDYQNGGFLPREKRALRPMSQSNLGKLVEKMAHFRIVEEDALLKHRLLKIALVLKN